MPKLDVFFDLTCPFCFKVHNSFIELAGEFPSVEVVWRPVEAHPRAEEPEHRPYVDLAVQGALFLKAKGCDELAYYDRVYGTRFGSGAERARFEDRKSVEDIAVLAECAAPSLLEPGLAEQFNGALKAGAYENELQAANDYAYEQCKIWAVPSYVCGEARLDSICGVGVTSGQIRALLEKIA
jgi:predicted DsbA family dithiol-disulfide isomerase